MTASVGHSLRVRSLSAGYPGRPVLRDLSLAPFTAGGIAALAGPNGAGKSTLLRAIAGLVPVRGSVELDGRDLLRLPADRRADAVGFIPQSLPPGVALSVFETVLSALRAVGEGRDLPARVAEQRALGAIEALGLTELALKPLDNLSGGERQLAGLAQALVRDPAVLLLDEPTSALDLRHQVVVMEAVRRLAAEGRIVIVVLHDLALAARWSDRVVLMAEGRIVADGSGVETLTPARLAEVYGVRARVEPCSRGHLQVIVDGVIGDSDESGNGSVDGSVRRAGE